MKETVPGASLPLSLETSSAQAFLTACRLRDASQRRRWKRLNSANAGGTEAPPMITARQLRSQSEAIAAPSSLIRPRNSVMDEVVRRGTATSAKILGYEGTVGTLKPGANADIAVFELRD